MRPYVTYEPTPSQLMQATTRSFPHSAQSSCCDCACAWPENRSASPANQPLPAPFPAAAAVALAGVGTPGALMLRSGVLACVVGVVVVVL